jgi:hypothetical protein
MIPSGDTLGAKICNSNLVLSYPVCVQAQEGDLVRDIDSHEADITDVKAQQLCGVPDERSIVLDLM